MCLHVCECPLTSLCPWEVSVACRAFQSQNLSAEVVREVVVTHLQEKEILDSSLPSSLVIGPFYINVDNVKQSLSRKRKTLATSLLDILAKNLHLEVESVGACRTSRIPCVFGGVCRYLFRWVDHMAAGCCQNKALRAGWLSLVLSLQRPGTL